MKLVVNRTAVVFLGLLLPSLLVSGGLAGCSGNVFPASNTTSDAALLYGAELDIDGGNYEQAISKLDAMSVDFAAQKDVQIVRASALAGACGLRFITFFNQLGGIDYTPFFADIMSTFVQVTTVASRCVESELLMTNLNGSTTLDSDEQLFYVLLSLAKMAAIVRTNADVDGTSNLGDGTADPTFDACDSDDISDDDVANLIVGFALFSQNLTVLATALGGSTIDLSVACAFAPDICTSTTVAAATPHVADMRKVLASTELGVGSCNVAACCP